ncbi:hypothetical protein GGI35DRAFT_482321 [Trichoderma velutinum]
MSSRSAVYNGSRDDSTCGAQSAIFRSIPSNPTYSLDRFVGGNDQSVLAPPGFGGTEAKAKAIAQSKARASAAIGAFNKQFNSTKRPPHQ